MLCFNKKEGYASYDSGEEKESEDGKLSLEDLRKYAVKNGEHEKNVDEFGLLTHPQCRFEANQVVNLYSAERC